MDDVGADGIEELAGVRHEQHRLLPPEQVVLEPQDRVKVEVVGGLVEQKQIGLHEQRTRQRHPHSPACSCLTSLRAMPGSRPVLKE